MSTSPVVTVTVNSTACADREVVRPFGKGYLLFAAGLWVHICSGVDCLRTGTNESSREGGLWPWFEAFRGNPEKCVCCTGVVPRVCDVIGSVLALNSTVTMQW